MRAVVFDLDTTLAVVERDRATLLAAATAAVDGPDLSRAAYLRAHRRNHAHETREPIFAALLDGARADGAGSSGVRADGIGAEGADVDGAREDAATADATAADVAATDPAALAAAYREVIGDALQPVPGVEPLLADLRRNYRVGLLTNGPVAAQRDKLDVLGWTDAFDAAVVTGELDAGKPDGGAFRAILDALGVTADEAIHVGDEVVADIHGATDAGLAAVQVVYDGGPEPSPRADAHVERDRLAEALPDVIAGLR